MECVSTILSNLRDLINKTKQRTFGLSAWDLNFLVSDPLCLNTRVCAHTLFMGKRKDFSVFLHFFLP